MPLDIYTWITRIRQGQKVTVPTMDDLSGGLKPVVAVDQVAAALSTWIKNPRNKLTLATFTVGIYGNPNTGFDARVSVAYRKTATGQARYLYSPQRAVMANASAPNNANGDVSSVTFSMVLENDDYFNILNNSVSGAPYINCNVNYQDLA